MYTESSSPVLHQYSPNSQHDKGLASDSGFALILQKFSDGPRSVSATFRAFISYNSQHYMYGHQVHFNPTIGSSGGCFILISGPSDQLNPSKNWSA